MKRFLPGLVLMIMCVLTACDVPFAPPEKDLTVKYINTNSTIMTASTGADDVLHEALKKANKEKKLEKGIEHVLQAKQTQKDLYQSLKAEKAPLGNEKLKTAYMNLMNYRIMTYNQYIVALDQENKESLDQIIKTHQIKDKEMVEKTLIEINYMVKKIGGKKELKSINDKVKMGK